MVCLLSFFLLLPSVSDFAPTVAGQPNHEHPKHINT